MIKTNIQIEIF